MKPSDLKFPYVWEERKPLIHDDVLFVPKLYDRHQEWQFPSWEELFGRACPIQIEYCSGNGAWIIEKAKSHPEISWVAVEKRFDRVQKIWSKMKNEKISNLLIVCGEALTFTKYYVRDKSFSQFYINFPDPWPKGRHKKNRLLSEPFITEMARASKEDAKVIVVTDHEQYADSICKAFIEHPGWGPVFPSPYFVTQWEGYGMSYFHELWRMKNKTIHFMQFCQERMA
jgi:tRNA (guanine-N7-)-methyltransferase